MSHLVVLYVCVCASLYSVLCRFCTFLSRLCPVLSPGSTLSAQSVPTMYPGQLALLAPGGLADSCSNTLLQPLKPCPSSNNPCSAYTSEGALSVPSLCAPTPGRHVMEILHHKARASVQTQMHACGSHHLTITYPRHIFSILLHQYLSLCKLCDANCYALPVYSFTGISSLPPHLHPISYLLFFIYLSTHSYLHLSLYCTLPVSSTLPPPSLQAV